MMEGWDEIREWRRATRAELLSRRRAVPRGEKPRVRSVLHDQIGEQFPELRHARISFYWPITLPKIADDWLREELSEMLIVHERNIKRCKSLKT